MTIYAERPTSMYGRGARVGGWVRTVICVTHITVRKEVENHLVGGLGDRRCEWVESTCSCTREYE